MGKPTLFLHIGSPKTGTKSIQASIHNHKEFFENNSIYCPSMSGHESLDFAFILNLVEKYAADPYNKYSTFNINSYTGADVYFEKLIRGFNKSNCNNMLISCEVLFECTRKSNFGEVREWIRNKFSEFEIKIICYLRRQDFFLESLYGHCVRNISNNLFLNHYLIKSLYETRMSLDGYGGYSFIDVDKMTPFNYLCTNLFSCTRYSEIVAQWADVFGKENIIIRPFEKQQLHNGLLYDFYTNALNLTGYDIYATKTDDRRNEGVSRDIVEFILSSGIYDPVLFQHVDAMLDNKDKNNRYFTNNERKLFMSYHEEGNSILAREYLGREDGRLFYEEIEEYMPYSGLSVEKSLEIREKLFFLFEVKKENNYLGYSLRRRAELHDLTTVDGIIDSTRKLYLNNADEKLIKFLAGSLFDTSIGSNRPVLIYGRFGKLADMLLETAVMYMKCVNFFVTDRIIKHPRTHFSNITDFPVVNYEDIEHLKPSMIIITATMSGKEIRADLEKLDLGDTVIYPAYDLSDEAWRDIYFPLTTPDGYSRHKLKEGGIRAI